VDNPTFRGNFPEFSDQSVYPDSQVTFWATLAEAQLNQCKWGSIWTTACNLYVAHNIVIAKQNVAAGAIGGSPGQSGGITNSKTVGSVTAAYDAASQSEVGAGFWNRTTYGQQLYRLIKIYGAGCIQL